MRPYHLELAPGEAAKDFPLRTDNLTEVQDFLFDVDDSVQHFTSRICHHLALEFRNFQRELIEGGLVIFDDVVQEGMGDPVGSACHMNSALQALFFGNLGAAHWDCVVGHQEISPEKEIEFGRGENILLAAVIDPMNDHEQIGGKAVTLFRGVFVHLGRWADGDTIFDRERMEMENILENGLNFRGGGSLEID